MNRSEFVQFVMKLHSKCVLCANFKERILRRGLGYIEKYNGMQCGSIEYITNEYYKMLEEEKNDKRIG